MNTHIQAQDWEHMSRTWSEASRVCALHADTRTLTHTQTYSAVQMARGGPMTPVGTRTGWLGLVRGPRYRHFRGDTQGHLCLFGTLGLEGVQAVVALGDDSPYLRNENTHIHTYT